MERQKKKCYRCEGTGRVKITRYVKTGWLTQERREVEEVCSNCSGIESNEYESYYDSIFRELGDLVPKLGVDIHERIVRSGLNAGVVFNGFYQIDNCGHISSLIPKWYCLILYRDIVFLIPRDYRRPHFFDKGEVTKIHNVGGNIYPMGMNLHHTEITDGKIGDGWDGRDESKDWDYALSCLREIYTILGEVDLDTAPKPFLNYLPGLVEVRNGFLIGVKLSTAIKIDAITGFQYKPCNGESDGVIEICTGATSLKLTSSQGAEHANHILMEMLVNKEHY